jgi:hypothetical protein
MLADLERADYRREEAMKTDGTPFQVKTGKPEKPDSMPRMPHERDESDDSQQSGQRKVMKQAFDDIQNGQKDTDAREQRGVEKTVEGVESVENAKRGSTP